MEVVLNGKFIKESDCTFKTSNRAFLYGDGFFETLFIKKNDIPFFREHYNRILAAFECFHLNTTELPSKEAFTQLILSCASKNKLDFGRVKIIFWRSEGGFYKPTTNSFQYLITVLPLTELMLKNKTAIFSTQKHNTESITSRFKTLSSLNYVLAGIELSNSKADDIILLDQNNHVSEALYSNLFWVKENKTYTPSLKTGCVNGIMRQVIINQYSGNIIEGEFTKNHLLEADEVFTTNSLSIQNIHQINQTTFLKTEEASKLKQLLFSKYL